MVESRLVRSGSVLKVRGHAVWLARSEVRMGHFVEVRDLALATLFQDEAELALVRDSHPGEVEPQLVEVVISTRVIE